MNLPAPAFAAPSATERVAPSAFTRERSSSAFSANASSLIRVPIGAASIPATSTIPSRYPLN